MSRKHVSTTWGRPQPPRPIRADRYSASYGWPLSVNSGHRKKKDRRKAVFSMRQYRDRGPSSLLLLLLLLQDSVYRLNDPLILVGLAVNNDVMNSLLNPRHVDRVLFGKTVVPTAVPDTQEVRIFLVCVGELSTRQLLDVDVSIRVGIFG